MTQFGNKIAMVNTRRVTRIKSRRKTMKSRKNKRPENRKSKTRNSETRKSIKSENKRNARPSYTQSMKIQKHAYSCHTCKIRRPLKRRSLGAMVIVAVRRVSGLSGGTVCDILSELTAMRVQITRSLLEKVLEYFRVKRVLKVIGSEVMGEVGGERRFAVSRSPRTSKYLKKLFPNSIKDIFYV